MITLCRGAGLSGAETREAGLGALLHDVGKMKTPLHILNKPGRFTDEEFAVMKRHPADGYEILRREDSLGEVPLSIVLQHHERMDGSGYPEGRKGDAISRAAQMGAIVDVYDAITSDRCYHKGMPPAEAIRKLYEWSRFHFNPELVHMFVRSIGIYPVGTLVHLESGKLAWVLDQNETQLLKPKVKVFYDAKKRSYILPFELDLAQNLGHGGGDRILNAEDPLAWDIDVARVR
jgi:HD-GYP domain-containing protein (c-di-GMP phosphodiesterase class II)